MVNKIKNNEAQEIERILTIQELDTTSLQALFYNKVCAIRVPEYARLELCSQLSDWITGSNKREEYYHEIRDENGVKYLQYGVDRVGVAYNTTYNKSYNSVEWQRYYQEALPGIKRLRLACAPHLSPIDNLRLQLDELWPHNANVASFEGKKMFVGIGRIMEPATSHLAEHQPHFDSIPQNISDLAGQFSANIYLELPPSGGELELWDVPPLPINEIDNADVNTNWRNQLPASFLVKPKKGDLILINTRRAHAIRGFNEGKRVTVQCFIGLRTDKSLFLWN